MENTKKYRMAGNRGTAMAGDYGMDIVRTSLKTYVVVTLPTVITLAALYTVGQLSATDVAIIIMVEEGFGAIWVTAVAIASRMLSRPK